MGKRYLLERLFQADNSNNNSSNNSSSSNLSDYQKKDSSLLNITMMNKQREILKLFVLLLKTCNLLFETQVASDFLKGNSYWFKCYL